MLLTDIPILESPLESALRDRGAAPWVAKLRANRSLDRTDRLALLEPTTDLLALAALIGFQPPADPTGTEPALQLTFDPTDPDRFLDDLDAVPTGTATVTVRPVRGAAADLTGLRALAVARLSLPPGVGLHLAVDSPDLTALAPHFGASHRPFTQ